MPRYGALVVVIADALHYLKVVTAGYGNPNMRCAVTHFRK